MTGKSKEPFLGSSGGYFIPELKFERSGKVRDIYELGHDQLLFVATDRISAFDCIMPNPIPQKGIVLNQISKFWFEHFHDIAKNHVIAAEPDDFPEKLKAKLSENSREMLFGRSMIVRKADIIPFECVIRGYIAGSGWKEYRETGSICGRELPNGLRESDKLPHPIFTPATKAETGHDINVSTEYMADALGRDITRKLEELSLKLYSEAANYAETRGIIICDTKFEFGIKDGEIILVDEVLTPDSSRFWPKDLYVPGKSQPSFDKQFVRDYLESLDWDKTPPAPSLPEDIISATTEKYLEAYRLITGQKL